MSSRVIALLVAALVVLAAGAVSAQNLLISVDENGNGFFNGAPLPGFIAPDSGPGGLPNALTYRLPFQVVPGDVLLDEVAPDGTVLGHSDLVRFNADPIGFWLVFYSDREATDPTPGDLADVGMPTAFWTNLINIPEVGPEGGLNGASYTPTGGLPGSMPGALVTYRLISDVPEPGSLFALLSGIGGLAGLMIKRKR